MHNYSIIQKVLHNICFSFKTINKSMYEIEKLIYLKRITPNKITDKKHLFISGLPRAGTTILLNFLYSSNRYASLTYRDMPFTTAINLFSNISNLSNYEKKPRAHNDRIFYNLDSPEALDEIFFQLLDKDQVEEELVNYVSLILLKYKKEQYLSKNNFNYQRVDLIKKAFPNSIFLIPFRDPLQQSYSLLKQHINFTKLQNNDTFILKYMNYLGHTEFGKNHKPWNSPQLFKNTLNINYWLEQWKIFYLEMLKSHKYKKNCYFICYEKLTDKDYVKNLLINIDSHQKIESNFDNKIIDIDLDYDKNLHSQALEIYKDLN